MKKFLLLIILVLALAATIVYTKVYAKAKTQCAQGSQVACQILEKTFK
jgi:hypothetical protein